MSRQSDTAAWTRSNADKKAVAAGCYFDLEAAERVRKFFARFLRHSKGQFAGKPFELLPWQWEQLIAPLFGWKRADGTRRYRRCSVWIAKKNGKSTLAAAMVLYGLLGDGEAGAEVYSAAADRNQASIIYREAKSMVEKSPALAKHLDPIDTTKRIVHRAAGAFYEVLSKESKKTGHGINASLVVIDELHVVDRETRDTLRYAGAARQQPLFFEISTAGNNRDSVGHEAYLYAKRVRDGDVEDPELLAVIYEADSNDVWELPEQWRKANPSLGVTISEESFAADFREAKQGSAATQSSFKQLRLNLWQDSVSVWFPVELWDACAKTIPESELIGLPCFGALDLASKMDLVACVWVFKQVGGRYYFLPRFWCPEEVDSARQRANKALLRPWILAGHIKATSGNVTDYDQIEADVREEAERFRPREIAYDPWNATQIVTHLMNGNWRMVEFGQTIQNYNGPTKEFEKLARAKKAQHDGNPVMRFCIKNVMISRDANENQRPNKGKSADKIDGATAGIMSLGQAMFFDGDQNFYEDHEVEMV